MRKVARTGRLWAEYKRLRDLRDEQRRSGETVIMCLYCHCDTRMGDGRCIECESCGGITLVETRCDGGLILHAVTAGPACRSPRP